MADNLTYKSIVTEINEGRIKKLYLFYGEEALLINDVLSRLDKKLISPGLRSLNLIKLNGQAANYETIMNACETLPFMDDRKIVLVNDSSFFKGKKFDGEEVETDSSPDELALYLSRIPSSTVLVFIAGSELDKRKKIYNAIKKNGDIVDFKLVKETELVNWIVKVTEQRNKIIERDDAKYLSERVSGSLKDILNEIDKLCSYAGENKNINRQDIENVVPKSLEINIFQLVDSISMKNTGQALRGLNELLMDSEPIPVILTMIIRQYRLLLNTKLMSERGYSNSEISGKLGLKSFVLTKMIQLSKKYTEEEIEKRLKYCLDTDKSIKTGSMEPRIAVESLIVEFSR